MRSNNRWALLIPVLMMSNLQVMADSLPVIYDVEAQPLMAQAARLVEALEFSGSGLSSEDARQIQALKDEAPSAKVIQKIQEILDPYCLGMVQINPEARVKVIRGPAEAELIQNGWKSYLIKVHNEADITAELQVESPNAQPLFHISSDAEVAKKENYISPGKIANRFLEMHFYRRRPLLKNLSGIKVEYAILQIYTKDVGKREARIGFHVGQGSQDIGFRNAVDVLFSCRPSIKVVFRVQDHDGSPTMASFVIKDNIERIVDDPEKDPFPKDYRLALARRQNWEESDGEGDQVKQRKPPKGLTGIYPLPSRRLARDDDYPDFFFHPQIYRADGEWVYLPPGTYEVNFSRGPEYIPQTKFATIAPEPASQEVTFQLKRWIHMTKNGWYSADHHVHAAGCSHYETPTEGVTPQNMFRQALGEDLNIACVLTWGPCWYYQKQFFEAKNHRLSTDKTLLRYDVEVSGFPSSHAGHLCLLRLKEDDYPGTEKIEEWPSWTLPVLKWAKSQKGVVGYSHSGWGLEPMEPTQEVPNYVMPKFDGIGANEYIVTVVHDAVDFISAGDTPILWELNIWYHTLNCGFRTRISGETDFPCIYDDRVGMGRGYFKMDKLDFNSFAESIREGKSYVTDGKAHIIDFRVNGQELGENASEVNLERPQKVSIDAQIAAYLSEEQDSIMAFIASRRFDEPPYWHIERARIGNSRKVPVELIVNGKSVAEKEIIADGQIRTIEFEYPIEHSSWVALRILPSLHTNPIFVLVDDQPIRASKKSAEWCRAAVDKCWEMKHEKIREEDLIAANAAYDHARKFYEKIIQESYKD